MKEFLSRKGVKFVERDVSVDPAAAMEMVARSGQRGVPVTIIDGHVVVGFDRARLEQIIQAVGSAGKSGATLGISVADARSVTIAGVPLGMEGAYVGRVAPGSLGERLGLRPGDVIVEMNGRVIRTADDVQVAVSGLKSGDHLRVVYVRADQWLTGEASV